VYFVHYKCATTLYTQLFDRLGWKKITTKDVNWVFDTVFGHIKNPLIKHRKGIVESFNMYPDMKQVVTSSPEGIKLAAHITSIHPLSATIWSMFEHNAGKVHWIPLDNGTDHKTATFDFIEKFGDIYISNETKEWFKNLGTVNESTQEEQDFYNKLISIPTPSVVLRYIDYDQCLYDSIARTNFEPRNYRQRIADLMELGLAESQAQERADQEVASGEYVKWGK
jgi:hypothetical protein